jgi:hypothetical protein
MLFDDLSIAGSKIVQLSLATPSGATYNGNTQGATVGDESSGLAQVLYLGTNNGVIFSNSTPPTKAGYYNVTVGVANPYFGVVGTNAARLYTDSTVLTGGYTIQRKSVTVANVGVTNKVYDRTTSATVTGTPALVGKVGSDDVSLAGTGSASFTTADAGAVKLATISGYSLTGTAASNYQLTGLPISGNSLDNTIRTAELVSTEWVLADVQVHAIQDGFGYGRVHLWAEDGTLLGTASQSSVIRTPPT